MTKKDFELIADVLTGARWELTEHGTEDDVIWFDREVAGTMADALEGTNPLFNRARFLTACGIEGGE